MPGKPLQENMRASLRGLIETKGLYGAADFCRVSRQTIERAIGGLGMNPGTIMVLESAVARIAANAKDSE